MKESEAKEKYCPMRVKIYCVGSKCMAWNKIDGRCEIVIVDPRDTIRRV